MDRRLLTLVLGVGHTVDSWGAILYKPPTMTDLVNYRVDEGVALLTLTNPPANAYSYEMMQALDTCILRARMDDNAHVIVLTGSGEKFFCAGADIAMLGDVTSSFKYYFCLHANETLNRLQQTPKLVIAALNGHTVGGGMEVAMAADLRVAKEGGGKMGLPEVSLGVLPGTGGTQRLARLVGQPKSIELMATGETFDFNLAEPLGLVLTRKPSRERWAPSSVSSSDMARGPRVHVIDAAAWSASLPEFNVPGAVCEPAN